MKASELKTILENHSLWLSGKGSDWADLRDADLGGANLCYTDLGGANLRDANLDYSCFPLWCGGVDWEVDDKLPRMLAAFICSMKCDDKEIKEMQDMLLPYAKKSHRAREILGEVE